MLGQGENRAEYDYNIPRNFFPNIHVEPVVKVIMNGHTCTVSDILEGNDLLAFNT